MMKREMVVGEWDVISNECGSVHDTVSESLDSETLRRRKPMPGKIDGHSRWTGYSPDECYSPAFAYEIVDEYLNDIKWQGLPKNVPSAEEKVAEWMSYEKSQAKVMPDSKITQNSSPIFGHVQDRRGRGRRSRSIILRFEEEQRQKDQTQKPSINRPTPVQAEQPSTQESRTKRRKNMDTTSRNVGFEKPLPQLPRKASLKKYSEMNSRRVQNEAQLLPSTKQRPQRAAYELPAEKDSSLLLSKTRPIINDRIQMSQQERPMMPRRMSKPISTQSSITNHIIAPSPKLVQLVMPSIQQDVEQVQRHTMPKSRSRSDSALKKLEDGNPERAKSDNIGIEVFKKTISGTILRKPVRAGRERPRPTPIDTGAVIEANENHFKQQKIMFAELQRDELKENRQAPEEILYSEHPSALIPRPLSLPFRKSTTSSEIKAMSPLEKLESSYDRFMRHRRFMDNRPLMRCLDGDGVDVDDISENLYSRLIEDTEKYEARRSIEDYKQMAFWQNVRLELSDEE